MNPYESPTADLTDNKPIQPPGVDAGMIWKRILEFFSLSGSFSRSELLIATLGLVAVKIAISSIHHSFPDTLTAPVSALMTGLLYSVWGAALGKRSRDLGTTFTYGTVVGMLFPILGLIFLFQAGAKSRLKGSPSRG